MAWPETTYDGLPIAPDKPHVVCVVVFRESANGREVLLMHRCHDGPGYEGDWAWTPPAGARFPGEPVTTCAARELLEETGLTLPIEPAPTQLEDCAVFRAQADADTIIVLNEEHDRFEWVSAAEAMARCTPAIVAAEIAAALEITR